jgi:hypothetical protein
MAVVIDGTTGVTSPLYKVDNCIYENAQTITIDYTLTTNYNGLSSGPITIATGATVTVPTGSNWAIV